MTHSLHRTRISDIPRQPSLHIRSFKNIRAHFVFEGGMADLSQLCAPMAKNFLHVLDTGGVEAIRISFSKRLAVNLATYVWHIDDQWCICFVWKDGNAHDVEIVDYH